MLLYIIKVTCVRTYLRLRVEVNELCRAEGRWNEGAPRVRAKHRDNHVREPAGWAGMPPAETTLLWQRWEWVWKQGTPSATNNSGKKNPQSLFLPRQLNETHAAMRANMLGHVTWVGIIMTPRQPSARSGGRVIICNLCWFFWTDVALLSLSYIYFLLKVYLPLPFLLRKVCITKGNIVHVSSLSLPGVVPSTCPDLSLLEACHTL